MIDNACHNGGVVATQQRRRPWIAEFYGSAVGKKWVMAVTGVILLVYLVTHLIGNLKVFLPAVDGVSELDVYAEGLRSLLYPILPHQITLWLLRVGLLIAFLLHLQAAYSLTVMNRRARPTDYSGPRTYLAANYASRTMRWSGVISLFFIVFHLMDLTFGIQPVATAAFEPGQVYDNVLATFSRPTVTVFYVVANLALAPHIYHGAWSMFQSLGVNHPRFNRWRRYLAVALAGFLTVGNVVMPIAIMAGLAGD